MKLLGTKKVLVLDPRLFRRERRLREISMSVVAKRAKVPTSFISEIETGKKVPKVATGLRIARALTELAKGGSR